MLEILTVPVSLFEQNARILFEDVTNKAVLIDPGGDPEKLMTALRSHKLELHEIWLTHSHLDHCGAVSDILAKVKVPLLGHKLEQDFRSSVDLVAAAYQVPPGLFKNCPEPTRYIDEGDILELGDHQFKVIYTPGHSPGHVSFYNSEHGILIAGDTLFAGSIGRTDLPGGNHHQLIETIKQKLLCLPPNTKVLSGHGPDTTIADEKRSNPWLQ